MILLQNRDEKKSACGAKNAQIWNFSAPDVLRSGSDRTRWGSLQRSLDPLAVLRKRSKEERRKDGKEGREGRLDPQGLTEMTPLRVERIKLSLIALTIRNNYHQALVVLL